MVMYRILITGSRDWTDKAKVWQSLDTAICGLSPIHEVVLVSGGCPHGADALAEEWACERNLRVERHPAQRHPTQDFGPWPGAGPRRNEYMASLGAHICLAFLKPCARDGCPRGRAHDTHGTANCVRQARAYGIEVKEIRV